MPKAPASAAATSLPEISRDHRLADAYCRMDSLICEIAHAAAVMEILVSHAFGSTRDEYSELVKARVPAMSELVISVNSERDFNAVHYAIAHVAKSVDQLQREYLAALSAAQS